MPEATIKEHSKSKAGEDDIGPHKTPLNPDGEVLTKAQAFGVKSTPQKNLLTCISPPNRGHVPGALQGRPDTLLLSVCAHWSNAIYRT